MIELRNLHKRYHSATPADHLNFVINDGEFFTLLGPSGSGKSTILRMIAGLENPSSGEILYNNTDITTLPPWKRRFGMIFQQYAIFPHLDVGQNVQYGLTRQQRKDHGEKRAKELLELVGLPGYEKRSVRQLSGGEQQRVAIARALAPAPDVLLLDEPLSALDEKIRREMQLELRAIQRQTGTTFVYVTHDQEEALTMSDRIALLNEGKCAQLDEPKAIFQNPRTVFVANFFRGCNVINAELIQSEAGDHVNIANDHFPVTPLKSKTYSGQVAIRSENILLTAASSESEPQAEIKRIVYRGLHSSIELNLTDGQVLIASITKSEDFNEGQKVCFDIEEGKVIPLEL